jgi:Protein of unknown function (DUF4239)
MPMTGVPAIVLFSIGSAVIAMLGFIAVRKLSKPIDLNEHQTFLDAMCNIVGTLVSILLGLLVAASLDTYQVLETTVDQESNAIADIFRLSRGLPDPLQGEVQTLCERYCQQVVNIEWPAMAKGGISHEVFRTSAKLTDEIVRFKPSTNGETNIQAGLLQSVETMGNCRRGRILALSSTKTAILLPLLVICAVTVMLFTYLYVKHVSALQAILIGCVAVALGGNISLVYLLSKPFDGDWKIKPKGFELNLKMLREVYRSGIFTPAAGTHIDPKTHMLRRDKGDKQDQQDTSDISAGQSSDGDKGSMPAATNNPANDTGNSAAQGTATTDSAASQSAAQGQSNSPGDQDGRQARRRLRRFGGGRQN